MDDACAHLYLQHLLNSKFSIILQDPCSSGFIRDLNKQVQRFKKNVLNKIFKTNDFNIPVAIQILYRPFASNRKKDLDNITLDILKSFKTYFKNSSYKLFGNCLPKNYKHAIPCYEAIRLPFEKNTQGFLILRIYSANDYLAKSLMDEIASVMFKD